MYPYSDGMPGRRTIGVDMGGTKLLAGAVDSELSVHHRAQRTLIGLQQAEVIDAAVEMVAEVRQTSSEEVVAVGFGIPALLDQRTRRAVIAINLALSNVQFADVMGERLGLPGEAVRLAAERPDPGLASAAAQGYALAGPLVTELAHDGDAAAIEVLALMGSRLGVAIASFVNIFNPEVVVIGGGVMAAGELLLAPARETVAARALPPSKDEVRIVAAQFGVEAGMVGAAALAFDGVRERE